jgi:hypothetical protein
MKPLPFLFGLSLPLLALASNAIGGQGSASPSRPSLDRQADQCPSNRGIEPICNLVVTSIRDRNSPSGRLLYQSQILSASCVLDSDTDDVRKAKVREFWDKFGQNVLCSSNNFVDGGGNLIKYAIFNTNSVFIDDITHRWQIDLNKVDDSDGKTALDFLDDEMRRFNGTPIWNTLNTYYRKLRAAGAKHAREL